MQIFFLTPNRNMSVGKFVNWESLFCLALFWEHFIFNFKRVDIRKMSEVIWVKMYCKMGDLFRWFLLGLIFSAINSGIKKIWWSDDGTHGIKLYAPNNISKKKITNMRFGIIYILIQVSILWDCFWAVFFNFSSSVKRGNQHFYSAPLPSLPSFTTKTLSMVLYKYRKR